MAYHPALPKGMNKSKVMANDHDEDDVPPHGANPPKGKHNTTNESKIARLARLAYKDHGGGTHGKSGTSNQSQPGGKPARVES